MREIRLGREARADLIEIASYLIEQTEETSLGRRFLVAFEETVRLLARYPQMGREIDFGDGVRARSFVVRRFHRYRIFYEDRVSVLRVIRVLHGARDVDSILTDTE